MLYAPNEAPDASGHWATVLIHTSRPARQRDCCENEPLCDLPLQHVSVNDDVAPKRRGAPRF